MNPFEGEYENHIKVIVAAFFFAALGDLLYGGVEGAEESLVGIVLGNVSNLFFNVFLIMVLFTLVTRFFCSEFFYGCINKMADANQPKSKRKSRK